MKPNGTDTIPSSQVEMYANMRLFYSQIRPYVSHENRDDLRLFTKTPRDSEKWKLIYKRRTSIERSNKREKIDYKLESGRHRSTMMWYMRTLQHYDLPARGCMVRQPETGVGSVENLVLAFHCLNFLKNRLKNWWSLPFFETGFHLPTFPAN